MTMRLSELKPKQVGIILSVNTSNDTQLSEMGFVKGAEVSKVYSTLGIAAYRLSNMTPVAIRNDMANDILIMSTH